MTEDRLQKGDDRALECGVRNELLAQGTGRMVCPELYLS